jgi:hypothetical protein
MISIEVVYALPDRQLMLSVTVNEGCTAVQALAQSGLQAQFPEVKFSLLDMGIFSRVLDGRANPSPDEYIMRDGDRLEIYRPLQVDPKKARLQRAAKKQKAAR